jgi:regulatory protein
MQITRIRRHPRRDRARIHVDGEAEPRLELALDLVAREGLAPGDTLTAARIRDLQREDGVYRAREAALSLLSHRARSRAELRRRLLRKEHPTPVVEQVLGWLDDRGYLDDRSFAEAFVRDRLRLRPRGRIGLLQELRRKGIDDGTAEAAVEAVLRDEEVDEGSLAREAADAWARKNASSLRRARRSREDRERARRRLYGHLARRGFAPDAVRGAIDRVFHD